MVTAAMLNNNEVVPLKEYATTYYPNSTDVGRAVLLNVKPGTVVTDAKGQFTGARSHVHVNIVGAAVSCNIVERLLNDSEEGERDLVVQFCGNAGAVASYVNCVLLGELPAQF